MAAHSSALRQGRVSAPGNIYLITTVTRDRMPVFANFRLARLTINELRTSDTLGRCQTLAFALMPNHLHWLMMLKQGTLPNVVGQFKANAAKVVNRSIHQPAQPFWQDGFHDHATGREEDLRTAGQYLVNNPDRAGMVNHVGDYPHWDAFWV